MVYGGSIGLNYDYKKALKVVSELQQKTWIWWHMLTGIALSLA